MRVTDKYDAFKPTEEIMNELAKLTNKTNFNWSKELRAGPLMYQFNLHMLCSQPFFSPLKNQLKSVMTIRQTFVNSTYRSTLFTSNSKYILYKVSTPIFMEKINNCDANLKGYERSIYAQRVLVKRVRSAIKEIFSPLFPDEYFMYYAPDVSN